MKTLLSQGFSRSLLSPATCGYLPYSRQNSLNLATHLSPGCPGNLGSPLHQGDGRKSRCAHSRERSTRRECPRGGLAPYALVLESFDRLGQREREARPGSDPHHANYRTAHNRRSAPERDHRRIVLLQGESLSKCDSLRDRRNYRAFTRTKNTCNEARQRTMQGRQRVRAYCWLGLRRHALARTTIGDRSVKPLQPV